MATATLSIDLDAIAANWRALDRLSDPSTQTGAVVKADAYGLGSKRVARALAEAGAAADRHRDGLRAGLRTAAGIARLMGAADAAAQIEARADLLEP